MTSHAFLFDPMFLGNELERREEPTCEGVGGGKGECIKVLCTFDKAMLPTEPSSKDGERHGQVFCSFGGAAQPTQLSSTEGER